MITARDIPAKKPLTVDSDVLKSPWAVDPDDAATPVLEARQDTLAHVEGTGQDQGKPSLRDDVRNGYTTEEVARSVYGLEM